MNHPSRAAFSQREAFTVVELLAVMLVMAVLIAILLPSLNRARWSALSAKATSDPALRRSL